MSELDARPRSPVLLAGRWWLVQYRAPQQSVGWTTLRPLCCPSLAHEQALEFCRVFGEGNARVVAVTVPAAVEDLLEDVEVDSPSV